MNKRKGLVCKTPGCNKPHHAHGFCQHCYDTLRKRKPAGAKSASKARLTAGLKGRNRLGDTSLVTLGTITLGSEQQGAAGKGAGPEGPKSTRLLLIKARHEAMKREIDQIREDLETEEED
ncbi:MAG: hypothetical protein ABSE73_18785 [Planctomycetota bacterium]